MWKALRDAKAKDIMTKEIQSVEKDITVAEATSLMDKNNIGSVMVVNAIHDPLGIFTERDLLRRVVAKGLDPKKTKMSQVMTPHLHCAQASDNALEILQVMCSANFRHLPVLDGKKLVGIVSLKDFYDFFLKDQASGGV